MSDSAVPIGTITVTAAPPPPEHDTSRPLTSYLHDARSATVEVFESLHGPGFLVRWIFDGDLDAPAPLSSPEWRKNTNLIGTPSTGFSEPVIGATTADAFFVYPLAFHRRSELQVGRAHTCQVCIADMSVSTIHADLELSDDRRLVVIDRGSTNGTWVGRDRIDFAEPAMVDFGKTIKFGSIRLTYMPVEQFVDFAKLLGSEPATSSDRIDLE